MTDIEEAKPKKLIAKSKPWETRIWKSNILNSTIKALGNVDPIMAAIDDVYKSKIKKVKELDATNQIITPQNLKLDKSDRGKFAANLTKFDHYHLKVKNDPRVGNIVLIYKQSIDSDQKVVDIQLTAVATHEQYDRRSFAQSCDNATYTLIPSGPVGTTQSQITESYNSTAYPLLQLLETYLSNRHKS